MVKSKRNTVIDFWKFIFSVVIVMFHSKEFRDGSEWFPFIGGNIAVEFFFIVSGVFMAASTLKPDNGLSLGKDTFCFIKNKILGLLPNVYVAWGIAFVIEHVGQWDLRLMLQHLIRSIWELLLLTKSGLGDYVVNGATWYLSAMILSMLLIYPLMKKYKDTFFYIMAPIGFIFLMGITYQNYGGLSSPHTWEGLFYKGMIRAFMEILLGCICFKIGTCFSGISFTKFGRMCVSLVEYGIYILVISYLCFCTPSKYGWTIILLLGVAIALSYSKTGILAEYLNNNLFSWLGKYSFSLYLGHGFLAYKMNYFFPQLTYWEKLPIYFALSVVSGGMIMYLSIVLRKYWKQNGDCIKRLFIECI